MGRVNSGTDSVSIARMKSPAGWSEPGQRPQFDEYTVVLKGSLHVKTEETGSQKMEGNLENLRYLSELLSSTL